MARKISPSDQCFRAPAGVRLEDVNDPIGIGNSSPISRPPVRSPVLLWHPLQKLSEIDLPRATRSGVTTTARPGTGAWRACCFIIPAVVIALTDEIATARMAAST